jgi:ribonuclease P protein subunit RPR2
MIRVARERIAVLFALAESESRRAPGPLPDRYVGLARRIGMRYNVRLPPTLRERYCRRCSAYWVEGRTVRTRIRGIRRVQTCLRCGAVRRVRLGPPPESRASVDSAAIRSALPEETALAGEASAWEEPDSDDEGI